MATQLQPQNSTVESAEFPYRFLLRYTWPEHIDRALRRLIWSWLNERASDGDRPDIEPSDYQAMHVFWLIVINPTAPPAVLEVFSHSDSEAFVVRVAENKNTWATTLAKLATHKTSKVRQAVACNHNTPLEILADLAHDECVDVRYAVAENANRTHDILTELSNDDNCHVAARSQKTLARMNMPEAIQFPVQESSKDHKKRAQG